MQISEPKTSEPLPVSEQIIIISYAMASKERKKRDHIHSSCTRKVSSLLASDMKAGFPTLWKKKTLF